MKKLIAVLLVLLVVSASFTFGCDHTKDGSDCTNCIALKCAAAQGVLGAVGAGKVTGGNIGAVIAGGVAGATSGYFDGQDGSCDGEYSDEETETPYWAEYEELENCGNWCDE